MFEFRASRFQFGNRTFLSLLVVHSIRFVLGPLFRYRSEHFLHWISEFLANANMLVRKNQIRKSALVAYKYNSFGNTTQTITLQRSPLECLTVSGVHISVVFTGGQPTRTLRSGYALSILMFTSFKRPPAERHG